VLQAQTVNILKLAIIGLFPQLNFFKNKKKHNLKVPGKGLPVTCKFQM